MPFVKHSSEVKELVLALRDAGWPLPDICHMMRVSTASIYRWEELREMYGQPTNPIPPLRGRPRIIGLAALDILRQTYDQDSTVMLDELQWFLAIHHDILISISALQATLDRAALTHKRLHRLAIERDEARRAEYRACITNPNLFSGTGNEFVCVDESSKDERTLARLYGRSPIGTPAAAHAPFVRGDRWTLTAAITTSGYIAARVDEGSMNAFDFFEFITEDVLPQMRPYPEPQSVLVLDNCRIHHNDLLMEVLNDSGVIMLFLPPYSPDLNPIEESFSKWKSYLRRHGDLIRAKADPVEALLESTGCITAEDSVGWFFNAGYIWS